MIVLRDQGRGRQLEALARLHLHKHLGAVAGSVEVFDTARLTVEAADGAPLRFSADGEPAADAPRLEIRRAPVALRVYRQPGR